MPIGVPKRRPHRWVLIAATSERIMESPEDADHWSWCPKCGALTLNKSEFWPHGDAVKVVDYKGALKKGVKKLKCAG